MTAIEMNGHPHSGTWRGVLTFYAINAIEGHMAGVILNVIIENIALSGVAIHEYTFTILKCLYSSWYISLSFL